MLSIAEASLLLKRPYQQTLRLLLTGQLAGRRVGKHWQVERRSAVRLARRLPPPAPLKTEAEVRAGYRASAAARTAKRRARQAGAAVGDRAAYRAFVKWVHAAPVIPCARCGRPTRRGHRHIDHVIPLSKGGPDAVSNLCVMHPACNVAKGARVR